MKLIQVGIEEQRRIQELELEILMEIDRICQKHKLQYSVAYGTLIGTIRHDGFIPWDDDIDICMLRSDYVKFKEICKTELGQKFFYQSHDTDPEYYYLFDKIRMNDTLFKESFLMKHNIHHGVYVDVFPVDNIPENRFKRNLQYILFHFYRTGLMSKYLSLEARTGKKKIVAAILRVPYSIMSLEYLYKRAIKIATKYSGDNCKWTMNFFSPYRKKDIFEREVYSEFCKHDFEGQSVSVSQCYDRILSQLYGDYMQLPPENQRNTRHDIVELKV